MENKQFWKVLYEHLERAATYAGKLQLLNIVRMVTQLIVHDMTVFSCAPNLHLMREVRTRVLDYQCHVQDRNGEAWEKTVSFCPKHQEVDRGGPGVAGGSCRKLCSCSVPA